MNNGLRFKHTYNNLFNLEYCNWDWFKELEKRFRRFRNFRSVYDSMEVPHEINSKEMQEKIIKILEKSKKPLSRTEIAETLKANPNTVSMRVKQLLKSKDICCIEINREQALENYHSKRRMRLYYIRKK